MAEGYKYSAEATFRGFRAQTLYILNRIITDKQNFNYRIEGHEDLDIWSNEKIIEVVQVKCYSNDLVLSDFDLEKDSSLFRRSIDRFKDGIVPKTIIVSFGNIGPELENGFLYKGNERSNIRKKLKNKGYENSEIDLIFNNIEIKKVEESELESEIFDYLKENHGGFDPRVTFDLLMNWIYQLSEKSVLVNQIDLVERLNNIVSFLSELSTFLEEFGLSVKQLEVPEDILHERLEEEFYAGIHARYEHIVADLDVKRNDKLKEAKQNFEQNNVLIIHGASGQGKSTFAYRFLHENYPNSLIYKIKSKERDALKIISTLNAVSKSIDDRIAIFIDVEPTDNVWQEVVKEIAHYPKFNILITIREEDWNRTNLSSADLIYSEMEIALNKEEAEKIYENLILKKSDMDFINFEESWSKFGGSGPLLEFVYLITQGETLRNRLEQQISRIREEARKLGEFERLDLLRIVSIMGMYGSRADLKSILSTIELKDPIYVIKIFQEEYLLREEGDGRFIGALHPLRSKILADILTDPVMEPIEQNVKICLSVINEEDIKIFLLNIFFEFGVNTEILDDIYRYIPVSWVGYGLIIESLLWLGIRNYLEINNDIINEAYDKFGSSWSLFLAPDLTGTMDGVDAFLESELFADEFREEVHNLRNKLMDKTLVYTYLKKWLLDSVIPSKIPQNEIEFSKMGLSLFWLNRLDIEKEIDFSEYSFECFNSLYLDSIADFILGLHYFEPDSIIIEEYLPKIVERIKRELLVPLIEDDGEKIMLHCIIDIIQANKIADENPINEIIMERLNLIRKLYPYRSTFSSRGHGNEFFLLKTNFDDTKKDIPIENFPLNWLVEINATFHQLAEYKFSPDTWGDYISYVVQGRVNSLDLVKRIINNLQIFFRKSGKVNILQLNSLNTYWDNSKLKLEVKTFPKSSVDVLNIKKQEFDEDPLFLKFDRYKQYYGDFIQNFTNFLNQGLHVIVLQSRLKGKSNDEIENIKNRLNEDNFRTDLNEHSVINLHDAYKNLLSFQSEFSDLFGKFESVYDIKDLARQEEEFYGVLAELWRIFAIEGYKKDKKILKKARSELKNEKDNLSNNIINFLEKEDINVELVPISFDNIKENYLICNVDNPLEIYKTVIKIISSIRTNLNDIQSTDLKKLFLEIEFEYFRIIILVKNRLLLHISNDFPLFRALGTKTEEIDFIDLNTRPLNEKIELLDIKKWQDEIPKISEFDNLFKVEEVQQLIYHLKQLADLDLDDLGFEITQEYAYEISDIISERYQEVLDVFTLVIAILGENIKNLVEILEKNPSDDTKTMLDGKISDLKFIKKVFDGLIPEGSVDSGKIKISTKLENIDEWYNMVENSKENIYNIYFYFTNQLISEYMSKQM